MLPFHCCIAKKHLIPSCSYVNTFQRKGLIRICLIFLNCGQVLFCCVGSSKQSISSVFWHLHIGHKSWRCCSHFVCLVIKPSCESAANLGEVSGQQELPSESFTQWKACEENDVVRIVGSCAKSTE